MTTPSQDSMERAQKIVAQWDLGYVAHIAPKARRELHTTIAAAIDAAVAAERGRWEQLLADILDRSDNGGS